MAHVLKIKRDSEFYRPTIYYNTHVVVMHEFGDGTARCDCYNREYLVVATGVKIKLAETEPDPRFESAAQFFDIARSYREDPEDGYSNEDWNQMYKDAFEGDSSNEWNHD